jgi:hypothetical protein
MARDARRLGRVAERVPAAATVGRIAALHEFPHQSASGRASRLKIGRKNLHLRVCLLEMHNGGG